MALDPKQRKNLMIRAGAGVFVVLLLVLGYFLLFHESEPEQVRPTLGESDSMAPLDPTRIEQSNQPEISLIPGAITLPPGQTNAIMTIAATGAPIIVENVQIPNDAAQFVSAQNIDCPPPPAALPNGGTCQVGITWTGTQPVSTTVRVVGSALVGNTPTPITAELAFNSPQTAVAPGMNGAVPPGMDPAAMGQMPAQGQPLPPPDSNAGVIAQPIPAPAPAQPVPVGLTPQQQIRMQYLQARRSAQSASVGSGYNQNAQRTNGYTSWDAVGVRGASSSAPTDMSRVLTPDKPITAVIASPIDTRQPVTAVAMVDRDVYGNNGRTIVIPRGSRLIGSIGASEERVGIAWSQLIRPDGVRFVFTAASGDAMGRGGVPGRVNERLLTRYGYSLIPTAVSAAITAGLGGNQVNTTTAGIPGAPATGATQQLDARAVAAQILSQPLQQIAQDIYQRKSRIPVQITVPVGTRITVWATDDLRLRPAGEAIQPPPQQSQAPGFRGGSTPNLQGQQQYAQPQQNQGQGQPQAPQPPNAGQAPVDPQGVQVGTVDANGNYIPNGGRAPAPGPLTTPTNGPPNRTTFPTQRPFG